MATQEYLDNLNELTRCVLYFENYGYSYDDGTTAITYCQGTGTSGSKTFQQGIDAGWMFYKITALKKLNVITSDNKVNSIMATQEYIEDEPNELSKCVNLFGCYEGYDDLKDVEDFCKGTDTMYGETFAYFINDISTEELQKTLDKNIAILNPIIPYFEFTVDGKNTTTNKDIYYKIILNHGDDETGKTRIKDNLLKFRLTENKDNKETIIVDNMSYDDLTNKRIWADTIDKNTTSEVVHTYRLYMWISNDTVIGNVNQDYTMEEWKDVFASIKVNVAGGFLDLQSTIDLPLKIALSGDGLVAVNTEGERASYGDTIREYRYSGTSENITNNYVSFNNELWRIVGLFTETTGDGKEEQLIKIVRNDSLTNLPASFKASNTYQGTTTETTYTFGSSDGTKAYWNKPNSWSGNYNDWTRSGVMHYLNDTYLPTIETKYANMIENVVYHLGNSYYNYTPAKSYTEERGTSICASGVYSSYEDACQVYYNNQATWTGKVGLLYASDQAYTRSSTSWTSTLDTNISSWFTPTTTNWLLSPSADYSYSAMFAISSGNVSSYYTVKDYQFALRPVLYLKSETIISSGEGTSNNPFELEI